MVAVVETEIWCLTETKTESLPGRPVIASYQNSATEGRRFRYIDRSTANDLSSKKDVTLFFTELERFAKKRTYTYHASRMT